MESSLAQAKLSQVANLEKYARDFDDTVEHLMNQESHQAVNQFLNVAAIGQGTEGTLKTKDNK